MKSFRLFFLILSMAFIFTVPASAETPAASDQAPATAAVTAPQSSVTSYEELVTAIRAAQSASQERAAQAVEQEKVKEAWETGKLIVEHVLLHQDRANYGEQVIERLAKDLGMSTRELQYRVEFARAYPIVPAPAQLSWAHYRDLLSIEDSVKRDEIAKEAEAQNWATDRLRTEIKKRKLNTQGPDAEDAKLPEIKPGKVGVLKIVEKDGKKYYDLGFSTYRRLQGNENNFKAGSYVFIKPAGASYTPIPVKSPNDSSARDVKIPANSPQTVRDEDFKTYNAQVIQVTDGDTFHARIQLGFGLVQEQRVRLLRVDAPEVVTTEGKQARELLEKIFARDGGKIVIQTKESDQHGRPLANVFVRSNPKAAKGPVIHKSVDQELVDQGLAVAIQG